MGQKRWQETLGRRGHAVRVGERRIGGPVYLFLWDPERGIARRESLHFRVRTAKQILIPSRVQEAKRRAKARSDQLFEMETPAGRAPFGLVAARFVASARYLRTRVSTRVELDREVDLWRNVLGDGYALAQLTVEVWETFAEERSAGIIDGRGVNVRLKDRSACGPRTVAKSLKALRQLCRFAVKARLLRQDPTRDWELPIEQHAVHATFETSRVDALVAVAAQVLTYNAARDRVPSDFGELVELAYGTGHRIESILQLRWSDVDLTAGSIRWRPELDKVANDHTIAVSDRVRAALGRLQARRGERGRIGEGFVFESPTLAGAAVTYPTAFSWLKRAETLAGLTHIAGGGWHAFRRLWATERKHLPDKDVAFAGGWTDVTTMRNCYQQVDAETQRSVVNAGRRVRL